MTETTTTTLHPDVERLALLGWRLVPGSNRSRAALFTDYIDRATTDLDMLARWCSQYPDCGWRMVPAGSGVWALDIDTPKAGLHVANGFEAMQKLQDEYGPLPPYPIQRTGGGGRAIFFAGPPEGVRIKGASGTPRPGIDPKRGRQPLTVPPSRHHKTGGEYRWIIAPWELSPPPAPAWLLKLMREPDPPPRVETIPPQWREIGAQKFLDHAVKKILGTGEGGRNDKVNAWAFYAARFAAGGCMPVEHAMQEIAAAARKLGLDDPEIRGILKSAFKRGLTQPIYADQRTPMSRR